jgi:hypothetical protein
MRVGCLAQPGKLRQVADGFSTGCPRAVRRQAAQRCKQQQPTFLDTEAAVLHKHVDRKTLGQIVDELLEIRAIAS